METRLFSDTESCIFCTLCHLWEHSSVLTASEQMTHYVLPLCAVFHHTVDRPSPDMLTLNVPELWRINESTWNKTQWSTMLCCFRAVSTSHSIMRRRFLSSHPEAIVWYVGFFLLQGIFHEHVELRKVGRCLWHLSACGFMMDAEGRKRTACWMVNHLQRLSSIMAYLCPLYVGNRYVHLWEVRQQQKMVTVEEVVIKYQLRKRQHCRWLAGF